MKTLFRVYDNELKKYRTEKDGDYSLGVLSGRVRGIYGERFDDMEAEQFSGLISMDNKKAYFNDIIEYQNTEGEAKKALIWYDEQLHCLMVGNFPYHKLYNSGFIQPSKLEFFIIGNLRQNPELIKSLNYGNP